MSLTKFFLLATVLVSQLACTSTAPETDTLTNPYSKYLIDAKQLSKIIDQDSVVVIDIRKPQEYQKGHIAGALNIWRPDIQEDSLPYNGMIASKQKIEKLLSELGVSTDDHLVLYDNKASCDAARFWWVLDYYGFQSTSLLNGGIKAWQKLYSLTKEVPAREHTHFVLPKEGVQKRSISLDEIINASKDSILVIIDSRTPEEYAGKVQKKGAFNKGRIPGSINIDWAEAVNNKDDTFKEKANLRALYRAKGIDSISSIIVYCHSGVRSAHTTFVLTELLGFQNVKNYDGSWIEWSYNQLPLERDSLSVN